MHSYNRCNSYLTTSPCLFVIFSYCFRLSPYSAGKVVATPDQLRHYVDAYAKPATATASPIGGDQAAFSSYNQAAYQPYYDPSVDAASPVLPLGRDAPTYRPSLVSTFGPWFSVHT